MTMLDNIPLLTFMTRPSSEPSMLVAQLCVIFLLTAMVSILLHTFILRLESRSIRTQSPWDDALVSAATRPASWLLWVYGMSWAVSLLHTALGAPPVLAFYTPARELLLILLLAWFTLRFIRSAEQNLCNEQYAKRPLDVPTAQAMGKILRACVVLIVVLIILQYLGYSVAGLLAFGGIGGVVVGFAAKDMLSNFFGGLMIYLDRPFVIGDNIRSLDKPGIEGTVEDVGWRITRLRTLDKRPVYVPNSVFTNLAIENVSRTLNRRIRETVGIRYADADKLEVIVQDIQRMIATHADIDSEQIPVVNFVGFAPSSLDIMLQAYTRTTVWEEYSRVKQDVLIKAIEIIKTRGAEIAFPTSTVHVVELPERKQVLPS